MTYTHSGLIKSLTLLALLSIFFLSYISSRSLTNLAHVVETQLTLSSNISLDVSVPPSPEEYFIVIAIPSLPSHLDRRRGIRSTWSNTSFWEGWGESGGHRRFKVMFIFGYRRGESYPAEFLEELDTHEDMYVVPVLEEHRYILKYKVLWAMDRSTKLFNYSYFVKTDDDVVVNLPRLVRDLEALPRDRLYTGSCRMGYGGFQGFPRWRYCSGGGYVVSRDVIRHFRELPAEVHSVPFRPEDGYTGWLVNRLNVLGLYQVNVTHGARLKMGHYLCGEVGTHHWFYHQGEGGFTELARVLSSGVFLPC